MIITGTDTGVGKTLVCGALCAALSLDGIDTGVMKPVESGCPVRAGRRIPEDSVFLRRMSATRDELGLINRYALEAPISPALAARLEGVDVELEAVKEDFSQLSLRHELVLVEGAGGLLSPLAERWSLPELARELRAPLVIVAKNTLGAINHCLLTIRCARAEGILVLGVVLNQSVTQAGPVERLNPSAIREWCDATVLGVMPFQPSKSRQALAAAARENIDLRPITGWLRG